MTEILVTVSSSYEGEFRSDFRAKVSTRDSETRVSPFVTSLAKMEKEPGLESLAGPTDLNKTEGWAPSFLQLRPETDVRKPPSVSSFFSPPRLKTTARVDGLGERIMECNFSVDS